MINDTIAAIATPAGNSGIGIIRVSGEDAKAVVDRIFVDPKNVHILSSMESHTIRYGFLLDGEDTVDEVMVSFFKGPKSFTAEDTVEINCHGGAFVLNKALELVLKNGARLALPGEFTKRAFLNGRIDLSKAEAVMDVIASDSEISLKNSLFQLRGSVFLKIKELRDDILHEIAYIESALDDPEHISFDDHKEEFEKKLNESLNAVDEMIVSSDNGRIIKDGIRTVIAGKPNAGKSSLLNLFSGSDRAIVTDIAGTTRDIIEERIKLDDITLCLTDTAGIRQTDDPVESIGVNRARQYLDNADLILFVVDSSVALDENDLEIKDLLKGKKSIVLYNKSDLEPVVSIEDIRALIPDACVIRTSALSGDGYEEFKNAVKDMFIKGNIDVGNEIIITNLRHKEALKEASDSLKNVKDSLDNSLPEDFYTVDLMNAYLFLGSIIGEEVDDDLVNKIFSEFCMGK
ncbi:MAG: tRNA uridine-5-carboxymethylaminomethyl(34) synthesis GTPase MnmE [Lachnospiraceae bacterium]|nr:tRNA uridine-5-carboxymethylaminomethyl(34) synthesis GTPase MnmE [Lachnospiraceae bacterium]